MFRSENIGQLQLLRYSHNLCYSYITISFSKYILHAVMSSSSHATPGDLGKGWYFAI